MIKVAERKVDFKIVTDSAKGEKAAFIQMYIT